MKIVLDSKDLKAKLTSILAAEGVGMGADPVWTVDAEGDPVVTLDRVAAIPAEVRAKTIGEHLEVALMAKILDVIQAHMVEQNEQLDAALQRVEALAGAIASRVSLPPVVVPPAQPAVSDPVKVTWDPNGTLPVPQTTVISSAGPKDVGASGSYYAPGLDKQREAQARMLAKLQNEIEEEEALVRRPIGPNESELFPEE